MDARWWFSAFFLGICATVIVADPAQFFRLRRGRQSSSSSGPPVCTTLPTNGGTRFREACVFPFKFRGKTYIGCTMAGDPNSR